MTRAAFVLLLLASPGFALEPKDVIVVANKSMPESRAVKRTASTKAFKLGWLVMPAIDEKAQSTMSTSSSAANKYEASCPPDVSCVWK